MHIDDLLKKNSEWLKGTGPKSNIVISSRIRLARNFEDMPFLNRSDSTARNTILERAKKLKEKNKYLKGSEFLLINDLADIDRQFLVERHLMSPEHMIAPESKGLIIDETEIASIMINEEDHLRIQVLQSGFNVMEAWNIIDRIDTELSRSCNYAFSQRWGYLTACPTNAGTGLRGSVMLHLPALSITNQVEKVYQAISKLGLTLRGLYGEGTEASGNFFQISNQVTLGYSETELLGNMERIINKIIGRESSTRNMLISKDKEKISDRIWRAHGVLKSARIISSKETISLLSMIRLGVDLGLVKDNDMQSINELFIL
ncbi:MAG: protein arginine kinase, partial [Candidatus Omnitrophica bacterium]|nr:protein arginine kinase [Candidatus Omnitrophota bacterium]